MIKNNYKKGTRYTDFQKVFTKDINDLTYVDYKYLVFDLHFLPKQDLKTMLKENVNFRFQGITIPLQNMLEKDWKNHLICIEDAMEDMQNKYISVNTSKKQIYDTTFYAMLRFISFGFKAPPKEDIKILLEATKGVSKDRLEANRVKVLKSVGSQEKLDEILENIGIQ